MTVQSIHFTLYFSFYPKNIERESRRKIKTLYFKKKKKDKKKFKKFFFLNFLEKVLFCCIWDKTDQSYFLNKKCQKWAFLSRFQSTAIWRLSSVKLWA
jgi:hypothetical protein